MPAATKRSSQPSAFKSSTLGPQGQYVSTPSESETSANRPPPRFANSAFPKMKRLLPVGKKSAGGRAGAALLESPPPPPGGVGVPKSAGMFGGERAGRPSPPEANALPPPPPPRG